MASDDIGGLDSGIEKSTPRAGEGNTSRPQSTSIETEISADREKALTIYQVLPLIVTVTGAAFLNTASVTSIIIILPTIGKDLNVPQARQQWMVSAYALTFGCFLLLFGKLGDIFGKRLLFLIGGAWVTASAIGTAFSPNEICFDIMRALQGLGAAANVPSAIGIIGAKIPPGRVKNYAFALYSAGAPIGSVIGNLIGGILGQYTSWHVVFCVVAGCSATITAAGIFVVPKDLPHDLGVSRMTLASRIDWIGAFLVTSGLLLLIVALSEGNNASSGWATPYVPILIVLSLLLIGAFSYWEHYLETKTGKAPLIPMSIFKNRLFSFGMVITAFFWGAFNNYLVYATYFYQDYLLLSPIQTTLRFIPTGVVGLLTTFIAGFILDRVPANYILTFGITSTCISCLLFAVPIPPSTIYWAYGLEAMSLAVFGADTVYPCLGLFITQSLSGKDQALAGAMFNTVGQVGRALALAVATAVETAVEGGGDGEALLRGFRSAQYFGFACCVVSVALTVGGLRGIGKVGLAKKLGAASPVVKTQAGNKV